MEELRAFLKTKTPDGQREFARRVGTTVSSMRKSISAKQRFGIGRAIAIELESGGAVNACSLSDKINVAQILEWAKRRADNPELPGMA
ncbi:helix-turn-helix domain-containing protein [Burkholderia sp. JSH-S8]|nr:helix-turn-helix domain-containing protein [Burkholderia sp. JSH-S8]